MAYRFSGTNNVEFAIAPLSGYTFGPHTFAFFYKPANVAAQQNIWYSMTAGSGDKVFVEQFGNASRIIRNTACQSPVSIITSTSTWYLLAVSGAGGSTASRFHLHDGSSWQHLAAASGSGTDVAYTGTDRMFISQTFNSLSADVVCAGVKKADSTDLQLETLGRTSFTSWTGFGFNWLIGFDPSLVSGGLLQDQASPGTGDQIAISGTSVVADRWR